ncbi:hypothetical protein OMP38_10225 [Cohnella ginsengisoli]|uniref:Uncharacterized protein n=1 Tax=Cohnella ginsengisoli TaxID=425004 RepID=A0A9X4KFF6_9BACL|nr:hypothetical protein [Cohnella ginsengisoli]MDG0791204.1 hypothetical protein [Cohnella ginsengisoli]
MSEFTAGSLTLLSNKPTVTNFNPTYIRDLNEKWFVFMTEDTFVNENLPDCVREISRGVPVLYFYNFEDHFWGYRVVHQGQEVAHAYVSYELKDTLICDLAAERYPDEDTIELLYVDTKGKNIYHQLEQEVKVTSAYQEAIFNQFASSNVDQFRLFHIDEDRIAQLKHILSVNYLNALELIHTLVDEFKSLIQIEQMSWISSDQVNE